MVVEGSLSAVSFSMLHSKMNGVPKKTRLWIIGLVGTVVLIAGSFLVAQTANQPQPIPITSEQVIQGSAVIARAYMLEGMINCAPGTDVEVLTEVMVDSSDYQISAFDKGRISHAYGNQALERAGLLTARKAYFLYRRSPPVVTPPPGIKPTAAPVIYCPQNWETKLEQKINIVSAAVRADERIIIRYHHYNALYEAILRQTNNRWVITSLKIIKSYGNG